jgi:hypothetical protein
LRCQLAELIRHGLIDDVPKLWCERLEKILLQLGNCQLQDSGIRPVASCLKRRDEQSVPVTRLESSRCRLQRLGEAGGTDAGVGDSVAYERP